MSDLFHEDIGGDFLNWVFDVIEGTPKHTYQVLTKRPQRLRAFVRRRYWMAYSGSDGQVRKAMPGNLWLGVSVENPDYLWRVDVLREIPAAVRFVSLEPLLTDMTDMNVTGLDWLIVGGESGPNRRPFDRDWARSIRDLCIGAGVPFYLKQGSALRPGEDRILDGRTWEQYP